MSIFAGRMANAPVFGSGRNPEPGTAIVEVQNFILKDSSKPKKKGHTFFIGEHSILEFEGTIYTSVETGKEVDTSKLFKTGDNVSRVIDLDDPMYGMGNSKEYMAAVYQAWQQQRENQTGFTYEKAFEFMCTPEGEKFAEDLVTGERSKRVRGLRLRLEAWHATKNDGKEDFTAQKWTAHEA